jgi:4'-phosphopantetheinyl transferase EntD
VEGQTRGDYPQLGTYESKSWRVVSPRFALEFASTDLPAIFPTLKLIEMVRFEVSSGTRVSRNEFNQTERMHRRVSSQVFAVSGLGGHVQQSSWVMSLFPSGTIAMEAHGRVSLSHLFPEERGHVATSVDKRRNEFAAGRICARRALATLGFIESPLLTDKGRAPVWPQGATGSISHSDGYCVAVVGFAKNFAGIGIDTESIGNVQRHLWEQVFQAEEISKLELLAEPQRVAMATVLFCAKEAFYKCQFSLTRAWLGFEEVNVHATEGKFYISLGSGRVSNAFADRSFHGKYAIIGTRVVCGIAIETYSKHQSTNLLKLQAAFRSKTSVG